MKKSQIEELEEKSIKIAEKLEEKVEKHKWIIGILLFSLYVSMSTSPKAGGFAGFLGTWLGVFVILYLARRFFGWVIKKINKT